MTVKSQIVRILEGKTALVAGASREIGRGIALALVGRGARVGVNYRSGEAEARDMWARSNNPVTIA